ncbi:serine protease [Phaeobacter gallaeciensis]|uniref:Serine protease n=2 Tax=Roseobacteraceae TaxID=2854170 RepID=A0A366WN22_9RHOB|nr:MULTISPECIES: serine protease [Roseobacteraceae]MBT3143073.1 serine protease [Falsiruegeria litorea]MBT8166823.1 serine protease [Falsiruegeria litorea]RBW51598.1 serine protease [Phaeobacter gallaeciensis]
MADQFLSKIRVKSQDFVEANGQAVLQRHEELRALLAERVGPEGAALFAEPLINRGNDAAMGSVSWYCDTVGDAQPFSQLSPARQEQIESYLRDHLRPLQSMAEDPATADLIWGALSSYGTDDIVVVGDRPFIVNWGLVPNGNGANVSARPRHFEDTLGRFLQAPVRARPVAEVPPVVPAAFVSSPVSEAPAARALSPVAWVPLVVLLLLAGGVLFWLLQPGTRLFPPKSPVVTAQATLEAQEATNVSLRKRLGTLQDALAGAVCRKDGVLILPDGLTPEGLTPPKQGTGFPETARVSPDAVLPNVPERVLVPDGQSGENTQTLLQHIEASTVLILSRGQKRSSIGSGFVVGPGLIVTNQHVIANAAEGGVRVVHKKGGDPLTAQVLKVQGPLAETGGDFALLRVEGADLPAFTLFRSAGTQKLQHVIAAGFPADVLELDADFAALKTGQATSIPDLTVTDGIINTEQQLGPTTRVLMHSAPLSAGNSGGPLVDMCGRVVGVNSFVRKGRLQNRSYALSIETLFTFLEGTPADPIVTDVACEALASTSPFVARAKD